MRECGCPPWAEPCAHYDGWVVLQYKYDCPDCDRISQGVIKWRSTPEAPSPQNFICPCSLEPIVDEFALEGATVSSASEGRDEFDRRAAQLVQESA